MSKIDFILTGSERENQKYSILCNETAGDPIWGQTSETNLGSALSWYTMHSRYITTGVMDFSYTSANNEYNNLCVIPKNDYSLLKFTNPPISNTNKIMIWTMSGNVNYNDTCDNISWNSIKDTSYNIYESSYIDIDILLKDSPYINTLSGEIKNNTNTIAELSTNVYAKINSVSNQLSGKIIDLSTNVYAKINSVSDTLSGKINGLSGEINGLSGVITELSQNISTEITTLTNNINIQIQTLSSHVTQLINTQNTRLNTRLDTIENFLGGQFLQSNGGTIKNYYFGLSGDPPSGKNGKDRFNTISNNSMWRQFL